MFGRLARLTTTRPWRVLAITGLVFILSGVIGGPVTGLLNSDSDSFSDTGSDSTLAIERVKSASGAESGPSIIALVDTDDTTAQTEIVDIASGKSGVAQVIGGADAGPEFISDDGDLTYFAITYAAGADSEQLTTQLSEELGEIDGVSVGGLGAMFQAVDDQVSHDLMIAEFIAFPLLFIVALFVFRSAVSALLPLLVGGLTIVISLLVVRGINEMIDISVFALNLITGLGLGLAIDYSLFMVSRFREEIARVGSGATAVSNTIATAGRTVVYSAITIAGAGLSLLVFPLRFLYSMGIGVTIVALVAAAVSLTALPALFAVLQHRVNAGALASWKRAREAEADPDHHGFWYRLSQFVMRNRVGTAIAGTAILLALGAPFLGVKFTGIDATVLPSDATPRIVDEILRAEFTHASSEGILVVIEAPPSDEAAIASVADDIGALDGVEAVVSSTYLGQDTWQLNVLPEQDPLDQTTIDLIGEIRAIDAPGDSVLVGGLTADHVDQISAIGANIPLALLILGALTFITLFLMTGSVVLPIKALLMNLLTVSATFGLLVMIFQWGNLEDLLGFTSSGALESSQPVFIFAVVFGLSTDYAVFLLTRIKEARDAGAGERESVALGLQRTGRIVTAAALLFAIALGAFATSEIIFIKELGIGVAAAVLIDATLVRAFLVPSLMAMLGKANWWAPAPLRRLHERYGLREG